MPNKKKSFVFRSVRDKTKPAPPFTIKPPFARKVRKYETIETLINQFLRLEEDAMKIT